MKNKISHLVCNNISNSIIMSTRLKLNKIKMSKASLSIWIQKNLNHIMKTWILLILILMIKINKNLAKET